MKSWPFFCPFCPSAVNPLQSATFQDSLYCFNKAPAVVTHHNGVPVRPRYLISDAAHSTPLFTKGITMSSGGHYAGMAPGSNALHIQQSLFTNAVNPLEMKQQPAPQGKQGLSWHSIRIFCVALISYLYLFFLFKSGFSFLSLSVLPAEPCGTTSEQWAVQLSKHALPGKWMTVASLCKLNQHVQCESWR